MKNIILSVTFPSFVSLWYSIVNIVSFLVLSKTEKKFNSIMKNEDNFMPNENEEDCISIAIVENQAYWVSDNTFYVAELVNGEIDRASCRPVNVFEMSNTDIRKMLFILDNLVEG